MRVSHRFVLAGAILALAGCQGLNERVSYVNYDGYTGADFATAGADGAIDVVAVGAPHQGVTPKGAARQIAEAITGANFGPVIPFQAQHGGPPADGYQVVVRFGQAHGIETLCDTDGAETAVSQDYTAAFCKDGAALSHLAGAAPRGGDAFKTAMASAAIELFPYQNPEFNDCDARPRC